MGKLPQICGTLWRGRSRSWRHLNFLFSLCFFFYRWLKLKSILFRSSNFLMANKINASHRISVGAVNHFLMKKMSQPLGSMESFICRMFALRFFFCFSLSLSLLGFIAGPNRNSHRFHLPVKDKKQSKSKTANWHINSTKTKTKTETETETEMRIGDKSLIGIISSIESTGSNGSSLNPLGWLIDCKLKWNFQTIEPINKKNRQTVEFRSAPSDDSVSCAASIANCVQRLQFW